jgi:hypothetical protein
MIPEILRNEVRIIGLAMLLYAAVALICHGVAQPDLKTTEKLLEIELHQAAISDTRKPPPPRYQLSQMPALPARQLLSPLPQGRRD